MAPCERSRGERSSDPWPAPPADDPSRRYPRGPASFGETDGPSRHPRPRTPLYRTVRVETLRHHRTSPPSAPALPGALPQRAEPSSHERRRKSLSTPPDRAPQQGAAVDPPVVKTFRLRIHQVPRRRPHVGVDAKHVERRVGWQRVGLGAPPVAARPHRADRSLNRLCLGGAGAFESSSEVGPCAGRSGRGGGAPADRAASSIGLLGCRPRGPVPAPPTRGRRRRRASIPARSRSRKLADPTCYARCACSARDD